MNFKPTQTQRSVLLEIRFTSHCNVQSGLQSIDTIRISAISALFADCENTTVETFSDQDEAVLLHRFWLSMRAGDRVFAADVEEGLTVLRLRSWMLHVLPSREINLRCVYGIEQIDTGKM
jgi:hypothetical protein